ncbi:unnamed protein product, partial [Staurois parvus]
MPQISPASCQHINAQSVPELPFSVTHHQCQSVPINTNQCCQSHHQCQLLMPISATYQCCQSVHLSVPVSASYQCQSVPPI